MNTAADASSRAELTVAHPTPDALELVVSGAWRVGAERPDLALVEREFDGVRTVRFDSSRLEAWDSSFVSFCRRIAEACRERRTELDASGLPPGVQRLLALASAVPPRDLQPPRQPKGLLLRTGLGAQSFGHGVEQGLEFLGELSIAAVHLVQGRAHYRRRDLWVFVQDAGPRALGIVSLISFLVGLILAFVGAAQLRQFGAGIYVADLVGIAVVREMGAMMTAVIMAGRTGAAYAAQLGTMTANEEIDALRTAGISPIEFLVLPRVLSLCVMMPLLAVFSDIVGIVGGACVATSMLEVSPALYLSQTMDAITLDHFLVGLSKSVFFGAIVAFFGCLRGLQSGRDAGAVGDAATRAVVASIVALVVADGLFAVFFDVLGI